MSSYNEDRYQRRHADTIIAGALVYLPTGPERTSIACLAGKIVALGDSSWTADDVVNARGLQVLPGVIDSQVHFREPGMPDKEDIEAGTLAEKSLPYPNSPSGMPGVQTLLPVMLNHVNSGRLSLQRLVELTSSGPARVFGIQGKGRIAIGYDADFTIINLAARKTIENSWIASRSNWSPYDGLAITGWPVSTIVGGQFVVRDEELQGSPIGKPISFLECPNPILENDHGQPPTLA